ncbi:MAG: serpin family protein [Candidatus Eisenbacteria bacterium]
MTPRDRIIRVRRSLLFGASLTAAFFFNQPSRDALAQTSTPEALIAGFTAFGIECFQYHAGPDSNFVVSPLSLSITAAMVQSAATGETRAELEAATHVGAMPDSLHLEVKSLVDALESGIGNGATLTSANCVWLDPLCKPRVAFRHALVHGYGAVLGQTKPFAAPEDVAAELNQAIAERTGGRIRALLSPRLFDAGTEAVLVSALHLVARWEYGFAPSGTKSRMFRTAHRGRIEVPMMHRRGILRYAEDRVARLIELRDQTRKLAMLVVLPRHGCDLAALERGLDPTRLAHWRSTLTDRTVDLELPRFALHSEVDVRAFLDARGVRRVFDTLDAELPGLCVSGQKAIGAMRQGVTVEIDEQGIEAAAATIAVTTWGGIREYRGRPIAFHADRPFLFLVLDANLGTVLFIGHVVDPAS